MVQESVSGTVLLVAFATPAALLGSAALVLLIRDGVKLTVQWAMRRILTR